MRRFSVSVLVSTLLLFPVLAHADSLYFEFKPDFGESILVASSPQPVEQLFLPLNDHISGFDVWVSNNNAPGNALFRLYDPSDTQVAVATIGVPSIADSAGGTRLKVILPTQVPTTANQPYTFRVSTTVPSFRMYQSVQKTVLAHNAQPQAAYTGGLARIGGQEQEFAFHFALYEGSESTLPVLSNVDATVISINEVRITFNASEPVDTAISYGPRGQTADGSVSYSGQYTSCPAGIQPCTVSLPITHPGTAHDFTLTVRDVWGNAAQVSGTFTSEGVSISPPPTPTPSESNGPAPTPTPDTVAPVITNARAVNVTHESANIAWTTDEAANTLAVVQFGIDKLTVGGSSDSTLELEHLIHVANLAQQTTYTATVRSGDAVGNETVQEFEFMTLPAPISTPTPTPETTATPTPTVSVGPSDDGGGQIAEWSEPNSGAPAGGYRIDVIGADGRLIRTITTNDTSADLGELPEGARIIVYADHGDGVFEKVAVPTDIRKETSFLENLVTNLPYILAGLGVAAIVGALGWRKFHKPRQPATKLEQPVEEGSTDQFMSHH